MYKENNGLINKKIVIWEGYFYPWQGVEYLIQAASGIIKTVPEVFFIIVGDGDMRANWSSLISSAGLDSFFYFTGAVPYEDVPFYINMADVATSPEILDKRNYITGGSSLKVFECLACGIPMVVGTLEGNARIISNSKSGYVVDTKDKIEFSKCVSLLLLNKDKANEMGKRGMRYVRKHYDWVIISNKVEDMLVSLVGNE